MPNSFVTCKYLGHFIFILVRNVHREGGIEFICLYPTEWAWHSMWMENFAVCLLCCAALCACACLLCMYNVCVCLGTAVKLIDESVRTCCIMLWVIVILYF